MKTLTSSISAADAMLAAAPAPRDEEVTVTVEGSGADATVDPRSPYMSKSSSLSMWGQQCDERENCALNKGVNVGNVFSSLSLLSLGKGSTPAQ